jgi:hypothetical protein
MEYKWAISALDCAISKDGLTNVVETIHWRYMGTNENGVSCEKYGALPVGEPNPEEFVDYENLTVEVVSSWLESIMDMEVLNQKILDCINLKENPIHITLPLPSVGKPNEEEK